MFTDTVLLSFGIALAAVTIIAVLSPMVIQAIGNARDGGLRDKLALLSVKAGTSEPLTEDDIADVMGRLTMGRYKSSPELRESIAGLLRKPRVVALVVEPRISNPSPAIQALVEKAQEEFRALGDPRGESGTRHILDEEGNSKFSEHRILLGGVPQEPRVHALDQYTKVISGSVELIVGAGDAESRFEFRQGEYFRVVAGVTHRPGEHPQEAHTIDVFL